MFFDFDTMLGEDIAIVSPGPDASIDRDEISHRNLFCYGDDWDAPASPASCASIETLSSSGRSSTLSSIGSSVFADAGAAADDRSPGGRCNSTDDSFGISVEHDLLLHVQKDLDKHRNVVASSGAPLSHVPLSKIILGSYDRFCLRRRWAHHIGTKKGAAVGRFLEGGVETHLECGHRSSNGEVNKFTCVELGTCCGYSALVLASTLCELAQDSSSGRRQFEFHVYTTEVSPALLNVAQSMFRLAKLEGCITPMLVHAGNSAGNKSSLSQALAERGVSRIDFLLLDHDKHLYLTDLQDLESAGLLRAGSRVCAGDVVRDGLGAYTYREHVHKLELEGAVESRLEGMDLEGGSDSKDGMEMTVYLGDPPARTK